MRMSLRVKIVLVGAALALVPMAVTLTVVWRQNQSMSRTAREGSIELADKDLRHIVDNVNKMALSSRTLLDKLVEKDLATTRSALAHAGGASFESPPVNWDARNQFTGETMRVSLPRLHIGREPAGQVRDPQGRVPVVDEVIPSGGGATIFQRMNEAGDMLRVATSVMEASGQRAIGTYIPARNPDGSENPVVSAALNGKPYLGRARVADDWHLAAYEPLKNRGGEVIGMLYAGIPERAATTELRLQLQKIDVGESGYVFVLNTEGEKRGHYVVSKGGERDGENLWEVKDADGNLMIQEMCRIGRQLAPEEVGEYRYWWKNPEDPNPVQKVAFLQYVKDWDWLIGASITEDESLAAAREIEEVSRSGFLAILGIGIVASLVSVAVWLAMAKRLVGTIEPLAQELHEAAGQLASASGQVSATSQQLAEGSNENASSTHEVSTSLEQMAGMTESNARNSESARDLAAETHRAAEEGSTRIVSMNEAMKKVSDASGDVSKIIKTIDEIAFQTNILALNAAVEAARAGEAGMGFAVVADEVRSLAQRCAEAAQETASRIEHSVARSREAVEHTEAVTIGLEEILGKAEQLNTLSQEIAAASGEQSTGITHIKVAINQMESVTQSAAANAEETAASAEELNAQAESLRSISRALTEVVQGSAT